jgi:hypothetical protein
MLISAVESEIRLRFLVIVVKFVLVSVAEIIVTPVGTEAGSNLKVMPPVELEDGLVIVLFFEHPIWRRKRERQKTAKVFFIYLSRIF